MGTQKFSATKRQKQYEIRCKMKGPVKKEDVKKDSAVKKETKDKKLKAKGILLHSWLTRNDQLTSTEEARAACKTRKRKERQESISSLCQERKVIRSNSEERPHSRRHLEKENIRRVSSSEDLHFQNVKNKKKHSSKENLDVTDNNATLASDECEHEKRRFHERFAKPFTLKCKKSYPKKPKGKSFHKAKYKIDEKHTQHDTSIIDIQIQEHAEGGKIKKDRSPSPLRTPSSPSFDLSTLHQQVDDSEPLPSCSNRIDNDTLPSLSIVPNRLLSSPRNSIIATHSIYLDPDAAYNNVRKTINPVEQKQVKISKQLNAVKKKIKKFENDYVLKHGCKPSHFDKINDSTIKKFYMDLTKLKKEYKLLQESGVKYAQNSELSEENTKKTLQEIISEIELKLVVKRESSNRSNSIEEMSQEQLLEEKVAVQKALLHLENIYGRPIGKEDRDCVRPLYDRYRTLKRLICKASMGPLISNDLETIHEDETIHFVIDSAKSSETPTEKTSTFSTVTDSDTDVSINENLHFMDQNELRQQMNMTTEEKKVLKRTIKEYEISVQQKTGKMVQKEDKLHIEQLYKNYKSVKSKLKLLDALIAKQN